MNRYAKGRRKEYKIINHLKELGMISFRSAGSHSPIDVVAIDTEKKIIKLIQAKSGYLSANAYKKLIEDNKGLNGDFSVSFEVI